MLTDPATLLGLGDGGAHVAQIVDASMPSHMLTHWARDRKRGPGLPLEFVVKRLISETADFFGFCDRGRLQPGKRADINVIDHQRLQLHTPEVVSDLPAGGKRLVQRADGYAATPSPARQSSRAASTPVRCPAGSSPAARSRRHPQSAYPTGSLLPVGISGEPGCRDTGARLRMGVLNCDYRPDASSRARSRSSMSAAMMWHALREARVCEPLADYGRLLTLARSCMPAKLQVTTNPAERPTL